MARLWIIPHNQPVPRDLTPDMALRLDALPHDAVLVTALGKSSLSELQEAVAKMPLADGETRLVFARERRHLAEMCGSWPELRDLAFNPLLAHSLILSAEAWARLPERFAAVTPPAALILNHYELLTAVATDDRTSLRATLGEGALAPLTPTRTKEALRHRPTVEAITKSFSRRGDRIARAAMAAGLYQWIDLLDESHEAAQSIEGEGPDRDGDYWHAIMHRREGDFGNSAYWFRRVGSHPVFPDLREYTLALSSDAGLADDPTIDPLVRGIASSWDPGQYVDACQTAVRGKATPAATAFLQDVQRTEMELLLLHCRRRLAS